MEYKPPTPETEQSKLKKSWEWIKKHSVELTTATLSLAYVGAYTYLVIENNKQQKEAAELAEKRIKEYNAFAERTNDWLVQMQNDGKDVYLIDEHNNVCLVLDKDTPRDLHTLK